MPNPSEDWDWEWGWRSFGPTPFRCCGIDVRDQDQTMFDPWSLAHVFIGGLQFTFIPFVWTQPIELNGYFYLLNLCVHILFELAENSNGGIYILRTCFQLAVGDTISNTLGDMISFSIGYLLAACVWIVTSGSVISLVLTLGALSLMSLVPYLMFWKSFKPSHESVKLPESLPDTTGLSGTLA